ncbi:MAG TPA: hypothetical protein VMU22_13290 [Rhizomicrobium sp.]|nr:hypothetical protein [Rhizomicrobium sp.]
MIRIAVGGIGLALAVLALPTLASAQDATSLPQTNETTAAVPDANAATAPPESLPSAARTADFLNEAASDEARRVADWVVRSGDNKGMPFVIIDKIEAKVFVFDPAGRLHGATLALLGKARGDDSAPGVGNEKLSSIPPEDLTTPAGRFVAWLGRDNRNVPVLWVDYGLAVALHRVVHGSPGDHRLARLATMSPLDKRITHGCINVPVKFFDDVVRETFNGTSGIVYILPEVKTIEDVFPAISGDQAAERR